MTNDNNTNNQQSCSVSFEEQLQRLHQLTVYSRWLFVGFCWLVIAPLGIWGLREEFELWREYFTWAAVRYAIAYNRLSAVAIAFCIGITTSVLVWQSRNILFGMPDAERQRLENQLRRIHAAGPRHPLWKWVCKS